jgi:hypothetical protein
MRLITGLLSLRPRFAPGLVHVEFVVDKVALGQVFLSFSVFPYHYHSSVALYTHVTWGMNSRTVGVRILEV